MTRRGKAVSLQKFAVDRQFNRADSARPPRNPIKWNRSIDKDSPKIKALEHVRIGKAEQLFRDILSGHRLSAAAFNPLSTCPFLHKNLAGSPFCLLRARKIIATATVT
jgi:hypothetical protein